jgi:membrane fusion protein (multidrug efflux system)
VGPDSGVLANVAQLDPVRVVFSVSDRDLLEVQRRFCGSGWITAPTGH